MYTSIEAVFSRLSIPADQYDDDEVIEWTMQGLDMTKLRGAFEQDMDLIEISNHKGMLPLGIAEIEIVAKPLMDQTPTAEEIESLTECEIDYINKNQVDRIQNQGIVNNYNLFINSPYFQNNFEVLSITNRPFTSKFHCRTCPNLHSVCEENYSLNTSGQIITSFESGVICIGYLRSATDENGMFIIPDNEDLIQGLAGFVMAKHWEKRMNMKEEGAFNMYNLYMDRASSLLAKARGIEITKAFNIKSYNNIVYKNIKWASRYRVFSNRYLN